MNAKKLSLLILIAFVNIAPAVGAFLGAWSWNSIVYIYWAECALLGAFTLFVYAKHLLVFFVLLGLVVAFFNVIDLPFWSDLRVPMTFWTLYSLCWLCYFEIGKSTLGLWIKKLSPLKSLSFYLAYLICAIVLCFAITASIFDAWAIVKYMPFKVQVIFTSVAVAVPTVTISLLRIIDMVGPRHFFHFLLGTYHRPRKIEKVVLFLDMVGSSAMAEQTTPERSMAMIAQFIFDAGAVLRQHGGDIVNYTGDGLTVLWPPKHTDKAVQSAGALEERIRKTAASYQKKFKFVPEFRIGLHAGDVVISQIGEEKLFLGLYGDVVNTAARIEAMNKELNTKILFSKAVQQRLGGVMKERTKPLGLKNVKGRKERIEVFTLKEST